MAWDIILESEDMDHNWEGKTKLCWVGLPNPLHGWSQTLISHSWLGAQTTLTQ